MEIELALLVNHVPNKINVLLNTKDFITTATNLFPGLWKAIKRVYMSLNQKACRLPALGFFDATPIANIFAPGVHVGYGPTMEPFASRAGHGMPW